MNDNDNDNDKKTVQKLVDTANQILSLLQSFPCSDSTYILVRILAVTAACQDDPYYCHSYIVDLLVKLFAHEVEIRKNDNE